VIAGWTAELPRDLRVESQTEEQIAKRNAAAADWPGAIPYIRDFSQIVQFGRSGSGEAFCFDFRDNRQEPSVIFWDDCYWRRVASDFEIFIDLFKPYDSEEFLQTLDEEQRRKFNL
jgi:hypothetical protein